MTELHQTLADLARDHGAGVFRDADAFRGALDDYLDEGAASAGTINLLTDAVRLGALQGLLSMLDTGAAVESAVDTAGRRLARDRGSADVAGSQWAVAVLGAALGRVPAHLATRLRPDAATAPPPPPAPPVTSPGFSPPSGQPAASPPQGWPSGGQGGPAPQGAYGAWQPPTPHKKSRTGLVIGLVALAVVLILGLVVGLVALSGDDDDPEVDDPATAMSSPTDSAPTSSAATDDAPTGDPALTFSGDGYSYAVPTEGWKDVTEETTDLPASVDTLVVLGDTLETGRGNVLVETSSAYGETEPEALYDQWKSNLESGTGAVPEDKGEMTIGGLPALGVELEWTNPNDVEIRQLAWLVVHNGDQYGITASFLQSDEGFEDVFNEVLATWQWQ